MGPISVTVVDANNITLEVTPTPTTVVELDRGVAGNGIVSIVPVTISTLQYLRITYTNGTVSDVGPLTSTAYFGQSPINITGNTISLTTVPIQLGGTGATTAADALSALGGIGTVTSADASIDVTQTGTSVNLQVSANSPASTLLAQVRNQTGATLTKGTIVYISGGSGNKSLVSKALATSDATSANTFGMVTADIPNNQNGYVTISGIVSGLDTSAYADGTILYLSGTTAGAYTGTKPYAPIHLVYVGVVTYSHPTQGSIQTRIQNGYELDELHNVSAQSPTTGQTIVYNSATSLWEKNTVSLTAGVNGTLPIANGGTGQTTANAAFNALAPSQTGNSGKYLTTDGTNTSWATNPLGTVTSVAATVPSFLSISGSPITTSGTLAIGLSGTALPTTSGGTGLTSFTANGVVYASSTSALTTGSALTFDGTKLGIGSAPGSTSGRSVDLDGVALQPLYIMRASSLTSATTTWTLDNTNSLVTFDSSATWPFRWVINSSEQMRLTSTGLGIGTSSPAGRLNTASTGDNSLYLQGLTTTGVTGRTNRISFTNYLTTSLQQEIYGYYYGAGGLYLADYTNTGIAFGVSNASGTFTQRAIFDATGNFGVACVPAAWGGSGTIALPNSGALAFQGTSGNVGANYYYNSGFKYATTAAATLYSQTTGEHRWFNAPSGTANAAISFTQAMTLDASGNLGIGTTSPAVGGFTLVKASTPYVQISDGTGYVNIGVDTSASNYTFYNSATGHNWLTNTGSGGVRMKLDVSGNLGLGVTPSAWGSNFKAFESAGNAAAVIAGANVNGVGIVSNAYNNNTNWIYKTTGTAARYSVNGAIHQWFTAPSGTAGNAISFTQAMTLNTSGYLGIGATSPNSQLDVRFPPPTPSNQLNHVLLQSLSNGVNSGYGARTGFTFNNRTVDYSSAGSSTSGVYGIDLDADVYGRLMGLVFYTSSLDAAATEKMRIDDIGSVLVGTTSQLVTYTRLNVAPGINNGPSAAFQANNGVYGAQFGNTSGTSIYYPAVFCNNGFTSTVGSISVAASSTAYNTSSDYRLKENVQPMTGALAKVAQLKPVTYTWKVDGSAGEGFIAHELAEVCPQAVTGEKDAVDADGKPQYQGVDASFLAGLFAAAIQELKAEFDAYKATHP